LLQNGILHFAFKLSHS